MRLELAEDDDPQAYGRVLIGPCLDAQLARSCHEKEVRPHKSCSGISGWLPVVFADGETVEQTDEPIVAFERVRLILVTN